MSRMDFEPRIETTRRTPPAQAPAAQLLRRSIITDTARRLLTHFHESGRRLTCKWYDPPHISARSFKKAFAVRSSLSAGATNSPIVLGTLADISFSRANIIPVGDKFSVEVPHLDAYLLVPTSSGKLVFICDDHHHAAFAWALAHEAGITRANAALMHIDAHEDNAGSPHFERRSASFLADVARFTWDELQIDTFIDFATRCRITGANIVARREIYHIDTRLNNKWALQRTSYKSSGDFFLFSAVDVIKLSLERTEEVIRKIRMQGRSLICDIDLDYFEPYLMADPQIFGYPFEVALSRVIEVARQSDFVTIATSPNFMLIPDQEAKTRHLIERIVAALNC